MGNTETLLKPREKSRSDALPATTISCFGIQTQNSLRELCNLNTINLGRYTARYRPVLSIDYVGPPRKVCQVVFSL